MERHNADPAADTPGTKTTAPTGSTPADAETLIMTHLAGLLSTASGYTWTREINNLLRHYFHSIHEEAMIALEQDVELRLDIRDTAEQIYFLTSLTDFFTDAAILWAKDDALRWKYLHKDREAMCYHGSRPEGVKR